MTTWGDPSLANQCGTAKASHAFSKSTGPAVGANLTTRPYCSSLVVPFFWHPTTCALQRTALQYEIVPLGNGLLEFRKQKTDVPLVLDGVSLTNLDNRGAAGYLYALELADRSHTGHKSRLSMAVDRTIKSGSKDRALNVLDVVASVRWMIPSLQCPNDVLILFIKRVAAEHDLILQE